MELNGYRLLLPEGTLDPLPLTQYGQDLQTGGQAVFGEQPCRALLLGLGIVIHELLVEQLRGAVRDILRQGGKGFFGLPQKGVAAVGHSVRLPGCGEPGIQTGQQQADKAEPLVKGGTISSGAPLTFPNNRTYWRPIWINVC